MGSEPRERRRHLRWRGALRNQSRRFLLVFLILSGAGCGLVAALFHHALVFAREQLIGAVLGSHPGFLRLAAIIAVPALAGGLLAYAVPRLSPEAGGGLALVRKAYARDSRLLSLRAFVG